MTHTRVIWPRVSQTGFETIVTCPLRVAGVSIGFGRAGKQIDQHFVTGCVGDNVGHDVFDFQFKWLGAMPVDKRKDQRAMQVFNNCLRDLTARGDLPWTWILLVSCPLRVARL